MDYKNVVIYPVWMKVENSQKMKEIGWPQSVAFATDRKTTSIEGHYKRLCNDHTSKGCQKMEGIQ